ncbi:hypothetical protein ABES25_16280 [Bacillus gobiensis]|uniref:hypothetical protein n=1 Tax=Bacillus gobiensis TaxID=1441095 RepID=UPI003D1DE517
MKKVLMFFLCLAVVVTTSACQKKYTGEYEQWGDTTESVDIEQLEENDIPYKIENNKVYIPKDSYRDAIFCCA